MLELLRSYERNYEQIAHDHVSEWRASGRNPFKTPSDLKASQTSTLKLVRRHVQAGQAILDAGCGMGDLLLKLRSRYLVQGVDIADEYLQVARERGLLVTRAFIEDMPFSDDVFDCVLACNILEHVLDLNAAVRELLRVLRPGGHLIIRVPNEEDLHQYLNAPYFFIHLRRFDEASLRIFLDRVFGLEIVESGVSNIVLGMVARKP